MGKRQLYIYLLTQIEKNTDKIGKKFFLRFCITSIQFFWPKFPISPPWSRVRAFLRYLRHTKTV